MAKCTGSLDLVMQFVALHCLRPQVARQHVAALPHRVRHPHTAARRTQQKHAAAATRNTQQTFAVLRCVCVCRKQPLAHTAVPYSSCVQDFFSFLSKPTQQLGPWGGCPLFEFSLPKPRRVYTCHTNWRFSPNTLFSGTSTSSRTQAQGTASPTPIPPPPQTFLLLSGHPHNASFLRLFHL